MVATPKQPPPEVLDAIDHRVMLHGVTWEQYEAILETRGDRSVPRIAYLKGELELMCPSRHHEKIKSWIGRLVETYAEVHDIDVSPYGSWTLKQAPKEEGAEKEAGAEPDECYIVGLDQNKEVPDLAIEVIWTHGGLDKLEIYRRLGVGEIWIWEHEAIQVYRLRKGQYAVEPRSILFPELDFGILLSCLDQPSLTAAKRAYRAALSLRARLC